MIAWRPQKRKWQSYHRGCRCRGDEIYRRHSTGINQLAKREGYKFPVIAIVDNLNPSDLLELMRNGGAVDVIQRPAINKQLVETVGKYVRPENMVLVLSDELIPRQSEAFRRIEKSIRTIAGTNANCIIFGECGTGKEQIANQIYLHSSRAQKPCTVIEAGGAALVGQHDPATMRSEMYNRIESYFKKADGGTIILKNIHLLNFDKQSVLLHILENEHPDVRVICTTEPELLKWYRKRISDQTCSIYSVRLTLPFRH